MAFPSREALVNIKLKEEQQASTDSLQNERHGFLAVFSLEG